jgi:hypothetical protein
MSNKIVWFKTKGFVEEKIWGPDDTYLVVSVQVPTILFKANQNVTVKIAPREDDKSVVKESSGGP